MNITEIAAAIEQNFSKVYIPFQEFQQNAEYEKYWSKCMEAVNDRELLSHIIFCNDLFAIPPVKTFLMYYKEDFVSLTGRHDAALDVFVKKSIGAFWGMVFKYALGYEGQKSVSVSMNDFFMLRTATCFYHPAAKIQINERTEPAPPPAPRPKSVLGRKGT
ncbi:MAG: hypothetical protein LBS36_02845 [Oscillospiraceae bacterium]|jgi:hypothetical protein|nr:hypothetical protein [Oscillospiraceae bacterium]